MASLSNETCSTCGSKLVKPEDFRDDLSRKEFDISSMCQKCQDDFFEDTEDDEFYFVNGG